MTINPFYLFSDKFLSPFIRYWYMC